MNDKEFEKAFGHTRKEFDILYNQIQWDNKPQDEIVRLSNNKLEYQKPESSPHIISGDFGASVYLFSSPRETEEITNEEWKLIKFYCDMDDDGQPVGLWQIHYSLFWYFKLFVA